MAALEGKCSDNETTGNSPALGNTFAAETGHQQPECLLPSRLSWLVSRCYFYLMNSVQKHIWPSAMTKALPVSGWFTVNEIISFHSYNLVYGTPAMIECLTFWPFPWPVSLSLLWLLLHRGGTNKGSWTEVEFRKVKWKLFYKHMEPKYVEFNTLGNDPYNLVFKAVDAWRSYLGILQVTHKQEMLFNWKDNMIYWTRSWSPESQRTAFKSWLCYLNLYVPTMIHWVQVTENLIEADLG